MAYYVAERKKKGIFIFCNSVDETGDYLLNEMNQSAKKYHVSSLIRRI